MKKKYDYLIVGAGVYGSVCANELNRIGKKVLVIDKRNHVGGNCYTEKIENINVHKYGPHIFHTSNEEVWNYISKFIKFNNYKHTVVANYKNELYSLPFNMWTFNKLWGVNTPDEAFKKIEEQKINIGNPQNIEEQALSSVGMDIYEKLIKGYTEKQWMKDCKDLPAFILKRIPIRLTFDNNYFFDKYQGIPENGYTELFERLLKNVEVRLNEDYFDNVEDYNALAENIIYTGSIDKFYDYKFGELEYRSLKFDTIILNQEDYQGTSVINYTDKEVPYTRITEYKHFNNDISPKTIIAKEYPIKWENGAEPYYPVNDENNQEVYNQYKNLAEKEDKVFFGGRLAEYKYYDMNQAVESALNFCSKLI